MYSKKTNSVLYVGVDKTVHMYCKKNMFSLETWNQATFLEFRD
jgi:hypothetical protein